MASPQQPNLLERALKSDPAAANKALQAVLARAMTPHDGGQAEVLADEHRFQILTAGRRWGKTKLAARILIRKAIANPDSLLWWIANYYKNTRRGYQEVVRQIPPALLAKPAPPSTSNELRLVFKNGSVIEFYSGGSPDALAGAGVDYMVVDEAALIGEDTWYQLLRPTLMDSNGGALIISTPRGRNWFWKLWKMGQRGTQEYKSWRFTTYDNPYIDDSEIDELRETLPTIVFEQEVLAKFVENAASIFGVDEDSDCVLPTIVEPRGHVYLGVDLAKKEDFTVLVGDTEQGMPCYYDRFNDISWPSQQRIIGEAIDELEGTPGVTGITVAVDSTGVGDVVVDNLLEAGYDVVPINFSSGTGGRQKERMVRLLAADLEHRRAWITEEMLDEFETFEYNITDAGRWVFEAATGHDDKVAAKMLAHWARIHEGMPTIGLVTGDEVDPDDAAEAERGAVRPIIPDSPVDLMNRPEVWA